MNDPSVEGSTTASWPARSANAWVELCLAVARLAAGRSSELVWLGLVSITLTLGFGAWGYQLRIQDDGVVRTTSAVADSHAPEAGWARLSEVAYQTIGLLALVGNQIDLPLPNNPNGAAVPQYRRVYWQLHLARFTGALFGLLAVLRLLQVAFRQALAGTAERMFARFATGHVVVCGLGTKGLQFAQHFRDRDADGRRRLVAVIEPAANDTQRAWCKRAGVLLIEGDATTDLMLKRTRPLSAALVVALSGDDGLNLRIVQTLTQLHHHTPVGGPNHTVQVRVHLRDPHLRAAWAALTPRIEAPLSRAALEVRPFNVMQAGARLLLRSQPLFSEAWLRGHRRLHAVFVEPGAMTDELLTLLSQQFPYPGLAPPRFTLLSPEPEEIARERLYSRQPGLFSTGADIRFLMQPAGYGFSSNLLACIEQDNVTGHGASPVSALFVCGDDDTSNAARALALREATSVFGACRAPIYLLQSRSNSMDLRKRSAETTMRFDDVVHEFGLIEDACTRAGLEDDEINQLARLIHENYRAQKQARAGALQNNPEPYAQVGWDALEEKARESNRQVVMHMRHKLAILGMSFIGTPAARSEPFDPRPLSVMAIHGHGGQAWAAMQTLAQLEHSRWVAERLTAGDTYRPARDKRRGWHPDLRSFDQLESAAQSKDFEQIVLLFGQPNMENALSSPKLRALAAEVVAQPLYQRIVREEFVPLVAAEGESAEQLAIRIHAVMARSHSELSTPAKRLTLVAPWSGNVEMTAMTRLTGLARVWLVSAQPDDERLPPGHLDKQARDQHWQHAATNLTRMEAPDPAIEWLIDISPSGGDLEELDIKYINEYTAAEIIFIRHLIEDLPYSFVPKRNF